MKRKKRIGNQAKPKNSRKGMGKEHIIRSILKLPAVEIRFSVENCCFDKGFCNISIPGNTIMFMCFISFLFDSSRGMKPKTEVHVCRSSEMAGITRFSTLREHNA